MSQFTLDESDIQALIAACNLALGAIEDIVGSGTLGDIAEAEYHGHAERYQDLVQKFSGALYDSEVLH